MTPNLTQRALTQWGLVPSSPLLGAAALIVLALVLVATVRLTGRGPESRPLPAAENQALALAPGAATSIDLRFEDRLDGGVTVYDASRQIVVDEMEPGTNGFLRGVLRALTRDRTARGIGSVPPFRLSRGPDGLLLLSDTATGQLVALDAFGPTNAAVFGRLLAVGLQSVKDGVR